MEKSKVWKYFNKIKDDKSPSIQAAQCLKCPKKISIKGSNTSGLVRHLEHIHKISIKSQSETEEPMPSTSASCDTGTTGAEDAQPSAPKKPKTSVQQTLSFQPKHKQSLGEIISILAAKDGLTIRQIARSDFIRESLEQRGFRLPKNESGVMKLILQFYEEKKKETITFLRKQRNDQSARFSLSIDEWTSLRNRRYFNLCLHHADGSVHNLGLVFIPGQCRATETRQIVEDRLKEFGLCFEQDVVAVTSDGPNVMVKFGRESPAEMVLCLNHAIHLSVLATFCNKNDTSEVDVTEPTNQALEQNISGQDSDSDDDDEIFLFDDGELNPDITNNAPQYTQNINKVLKETRALVKLFRKSPLKNITLQKYVKEEIGHELNLLLDIRTRWNSMMQMVERFLKLKNAIKKALIDLNMSSMWRDDNIDVLESLLVVLHPVKLSVEALSRKDATILTSEAIIDVLINKLKTMENNLAATFVNHLMSKIENRRNINLITLIKYLHNPTIFQNYNENSTRICNKTALIRFTEELYNRLFPSSSNSDENDTLIQTSENEQLEQATSFEQKLKQAIEMAATDTTSNIETVLTKSLIRKEFQLYESTGKRTPNLENLYKAVMSVKPTSTENERVFSLSGNFVTKIRNRLSDDAINALVFLKAYFLNNKKTVG